MSHPAEADDGPRTRDLRLGKPTLYQLSYVRAGVILDPASGSRGDRFLRRDAGRLLDRAG